MYWGMNSGLILVKYVNVTVNRWMDEYYMKTFIRRDVEMQERELSHQHNPMEVLALFLRI